MNRTLSILKTRWREVIVLLLLWAAYAPLRGFMVLPTQVHSHIHSQNAGLQMFLGLLFVLCAFANTFLSAGFVRLASQYGQERQSLSSLWETGILFILRLIGFNILSTIALGAVGVLLLLASRAFGLLYTTNKQVVVFITTALALIILMKPLLYMPALIIQQDCSIRDAWKKLRQFPIWNAPQLPALYIVAYLLWKPESILAQVCNDSSSHLLVLAFRFMEQVFHFLCLLEAVRVVGNGLPQQLAMNEAGQDALQ
ncbi:MAG: hypothetical protein HZA88_02095 [Verrucomicrobia bacterium]|nr:hypothetical protein [Verrucomicrobiota bacterium]